jgi:hypothetical protein
LQRLRFEQEQTVQRTRRERKLLRWSEEIS